MFGVKKSLGIFRAARAKRYDGRTVGHLESMGKASSINIYNILERRVGIFLLGLLHGKWVPLKRYRYNG